jgi:hypothetical protein
MRRVTLHDAVKAAATLKQAKWEQMGGWKDFATVNGPSEVMQTRRAPHLELISKRRAQYFERNSPFKKHEKSIKHGALRRELTKVAKAKISDGKATKAFSPEGATGMSSDEFYLFYFRSQRKALLRAIKKASGNPSPTTRRLGHPRTSINRKLPYPLKYRKDTERSQHKVLLRSIEKAAGYAHSNPPQSKLEQRLSRIDATMAKGEGVRTNSVCKAGGKEANPVKDREDSITEAFSSTEYISTEANQVSKSPQESQIKALSGQVMAMRSLMIQLLAKLSPSEEVSGQWTDASSAESTKEEKEPEDWIDVNPTM